MRKEDGAPPASQDRAATASQPSPQAVSGIAGIPGAESVQGPWTASLEDVPYTELGEAWTVDNENGSICTVDCPRAYAEGVARLIAAAPDLYEALEDLLGSSVGSNNIGLPFAWAAARAALAKASSDA